MSLLNFVQFGDAEEVDEDEEFMRLTTEENAAGARKKAADDRYNARQREEKAAAAAAEVKRKAAADRYNARQREEKAAAAAMAAQQKIAEAKTRAAAAAKLVKHYTATQQLEKAAAVAAEAKRQAAADRYNARQREEKAGAAAAEVKIKAAADRYNARQREEKATALGQRAADAANKAKVSAQKATQMTQDAADKAKVSTQKATPMTQDATDRKAPKVDAREDRTVQKIAQSKVDDVNARRKATDDRYNESQRARKKAEAAGAPVDVVAEARWQASKDRYNESQQALKKEKIRRIAERDERDDAVSSEKDVVASGRGVPANSALPKSVFELKMKQFPRDKQLKYIRMRGRELEVERNILREAESREMTPLEVAQTLKRITDNLDSDIGTFRVEMSAYINDFDRKGMNIDDIRRTRRALRKEYMQKAFANMNESEVDDFTSENAKFTRRIGSELLKSKSDARKAAEAADVTLQTTRTSQRVREEGQRNELKARKAANAKVEMKRPDVFRDISPVRSDVLKNIVRPEFQAVRHVDTIVEEMRAINPTAVPLRLIAAASRASKKGVTGRTFFPPQNANPTIVHPWKARFAPPTRALPSYMNWADASNVATVRGWKLPKSRLARASRVGSDKQGYMHEVVDQLGCGSCWVISVAGAMSDRASIWTQAPNPQLSITNILGCVSDNDEDGSVVQGAAMYSPSTAGCAGGLPTGAIEMFAAYGDATSACVGYEWCENDPVCSQSKRLGFSDSPDYLNSIIPACADMLKTCLECTGTECAASKKPHLTWGLMTYPSGRPYILLTDPLSIQQEIAAHGPVVATQAIYADFQNGTVDILGDGWAKTRGVYCNVQTAGVARPYTGTRYAGSERTLVGYHAVVIVGWGVEEKVGDWENPGATFDIPFWICRNSWGVQWNPTCTVNGIKMPGYYKIAITDRARNINTAVYLDNADDGLVGAAIAFMPMVTRVEPPRVGASLVDDNPSLQEEKIEVDATNVVLVRGTVGEGGPWVPDADEARRDLINHPIMCATMTDRVNCPTSRLGVERTSRVKHTTIFFILMVAAILGALVAIIVIKNKR